MHKTKIYWERGLVKLARKPRRIVRPQLELHEELQKYDNLSVDDGKIPEKYPWAPFNSKSVSKHHKWIHQVKQATIAYLRQDHKEKTNLVWIAWYDFVKRDAEV